MITAQRALSAVAELAASEDGDLLRIVLNASTTGEAHLAIGILAEHVNHKTLVSALNVREMLREMPASPFAMRVDTDMLARAADMSIERDSLNKAITDTDGGYKIVVLAEGNLCFELMVVVGDQSVFVRPTDKGENFIHQEALELILSHASMLDELAGVVRAMGMVFNPRFYLSLEDWTLEYAKDALDDLSQLFRN